VAEAAASKALDDIATYGGASPVVVDAIVRRMREEVPHGGGKAAQAFVTNAIKVARKVEHGQMSPASLETVVSGSTLGRGAATMERTLMRLRARTLHAVELDAAVMHALSSLCAEHAPGWLLEVLENSDAALATKSELRAVASASRAACGMGELVRLLERVRLEGPAEEGTAQRMQQAELLGTARDMELGEDPPASSAPPPAALSAPTPAVSVAPSREKQPEPQPVSADVCFAVAEWLHEGPTGEQRTAGGDVPDPKRSAMAIPSPESLVSESEPDGGGDASDQEEDDELAILLAMASEDDEYRRSQSRR